MNSLNIFKLKTKIIIFLYFLFSFLSSAQKTPEISLLTFETGDKSYTVFGHTAIRVKDTNNGSDIVYGFGGFDFDTPNFLAKFCTGKLDYKLDISQYKPMLRYYFNENRQVFEQKLNLDTSKKQQLIEKLEYAYRPENRYYRYRFLGRNCSTEVRDILFKEIENVNYTHTETNRTYRNYLDDYTRNTPWFKFGINLALGSNIDKNINTYELMFLPDFLMEEIDKATLNKKPLAQNAKKTFDNLTSPEPNKWQLTPFVIFAFLLVVLIFGKSKFLGQTYLLVVGLAGVLIMAINLFSEHPEVQNNYNLLWLNPLYLVSFTLGFTRFGSARKTLATILTLCLLTTLGIWFSKIQGYDIAFFPIIITLLWINLRISKKA